MSVSFPPDMLADIQQLALSLLQTQPVTIHQVMSFLGKTSFVPMASPNCRDCVVSFRVTLLTVYHSPTHLFSSIIFPFQHCINWNFYLICNRVQFPCNFHFLMWLSLQMPHSLIGPFILRDLVSMCRAHIVLQKHVQLP